MKTNEELQKDVQDAINWQPHLHTTDIGVTVKDGIVTLTGTVESYIQKAEAEKAAKSVLGVKAIVEHIKVSSTTKDKSDAEIAVKIIDAFKWHWEIPEDKIRLKVQNGWITLDGDVVWNYQREAAGKAVAKLAGIRGLTNNIRILPEAGSLVNVRDIEGALWRNADINDEHINVEAKGNKVLLNGSVTTWYQKQQAEKMAWSAPGVQQVENKLVIEVN